MHAVGMATGYYNWLFLPAETGKFPLEEENGCNDPFVAVVCLGCLQVVVWYTPEDRDKFSVLACGSHRIVITRWRNFCGARSSHR